MDLTAMKWWEVPRVGVNTGIKPQYHQIHLGTKIPELQYTPLIAHIPQSSSIYQKKKGIRGRRAYLVGSTDPPSSAHLERAGFSVVFARVRVKRITLVLSPGNCRRNGTKVIHTMLDFDGAHPAEPRTRGRKYLD